MSPSTIIEVISTPSARQAVTTVDTAFVVGFADKGTATEALEITSLAEFETELGDRITARPYLYDTADVFFREGGSRLYVGRRLGPTPVKASKTLQDSAPANTLLVEALHYGADGNNIAIEVIVDGANRDFVVYYNDVEKERFENIASRAAFAALTSNYVDVSLTGTSVLLPAALAKTTLTGGTDDAANSTTTELQEALDLFTADLGPGQVLSPGSTDEDSHELVAQHAFDFNRFAFLDAPDTATLATIETAATAIRDGSYARVAAMFAPWHKVPGPLQGQERTVPPSAVAAGLVARSDLAGNAPDIPAANTNGDSIAATSLSVTTWIDADRETLNDAGVNAFKSRRGTITLWGYRTLYNPDIDQKWVPLGGARLLMQIVAEAEAIAERFVLRRMDGRRHLLLEFKTALAQPLDAHVTQDSLTFEFDEAGVPIPGTAYSITTDWDADERELSAELRLRLTDMAETVRVRIVRRATTEAL